MERYQQILASRLIQLKALDKKANTCRKLNRLCGFTSPNYLNMVAKGLRNLAPESLEQVRRLFNDDYDGERDFVEAYREYLATTPTGKIIRGYVIEAA